MLPGELVPDAEVGRARRTPRDWLVDLLLFGWALLWWVLVVISPELSYVPAWLRAVDAPLGLLACLALWLRRRYPLQVAFALLIPGALVGSAFGALMVVLFNTALRVPWRKAVILLGLYFLVGLPYAIAVIVLQRDGWIDLAFSVAFFLTAFAWGAALRARRHELLWLRQEAVRQRSEHARRLADTRRAERSAIAREMHDVLAHRISLLSVHAAALAYRTGHSVQGTGKPLTETEVAESAQVIRDNAHQALEELREVLAVLRTDETAEVAAAGQSPEPGDSVGAVGAGRPQPLIADIEELVQEATAAGQRVDFRDGLPAESAATLRAQAQRTVYRVVQEGLTNARKHAPGAEVSVTLAGRPGEGLTVEILNPLPEGARGAELSEAEIPGARAGLIGLAERTALDGGSLEHGRWQDGFRLLARLPWPQEEPGAPG